MCLGCHTLFLTIFFKKKLKKVSILLIQPRQNTIQIKLGYPKCH